jgi:hypothetical protein
MYLVHSLLLFLIRFLLPVVVTLGNKEQIKDLLLFVD